MIGPTQARAALLALGLAASGLLASAGARADGDAPVLPPPDDPRLVDCLKTSYFGFSSGFNESFCHRHYGVPSAFYFKCARDTRLGFATELDRAACVSFLEEQARIAGSARVHSRP